MKSAMKSTIKSTMNSCCSPPRRSCQVINTYFSLATRNHQNCLSQQISAATSSVLVASATLESTNSSFGQHPRFAKLIYVLNSAPIAVPIPTSYLYHDSTKGTD
jgi:hypothetical protein